MFDRCGETFAEGGPIRQFREHVMMSKISDPLFRGV
jgi:hypothetical protein